MTHKQFNYVLRASIMMLFLLIGFTVNTFAQDNNKPIADETFMKRLKTSIKIETSNEAIFKLIVDSFKGEGFKFSAVTKRDRAGLYIAYTVPFKNEKLNEVIAFFERINSKPKSK